MWRQDLLHKLIWKTPTVTGLETYCVPPGMEEPYQAPSWSWTSINCPIIVKYRSFRSPHDCLSLVKTGQILAGAYLRITGTMYNAQLHYVGFSGRIWPDLGIGLLSKTQIRLKSSFAVFPDERYIDGGKRQSKFACGRSRALRYVESLTARPGW